MPGGGLPGFIIIGAMKCGTTSLHEYLNAHPALFMSKKKELDFFVEEENYGKGLDWYRGWFPDDGTLCGESSPNYTKRHLFKGVPERIHALLPDAKLIFVARDPIERLLSHWAHAIAFGRRTANPQRTFGQKREEHNFVRTSEYDDQLAPYLDLFSRDRILVLTAEDLRHRRLETIRKTFGFLGVDDTFEDPSFGDIHHASAEKTIGKGEAAPKVERPALGPKWNAWMLEHFAPHMKRFREMTGLALEDWSV